jgi:DNA primase small subunit
MCTPLDYYRNFFPFEKLFSGLFHGGNCVPFENREISYGGSKRFNSYKKLEEFKQKCCSIIPESLHIGAIYSEPPKKLSQNKHIIPMGRENVLDLDMNYESLRHNVCNCGSKKQMCNDCWSDVCIPILLIISECLTDLLGNDCSILFIYSGGKGVHVWFKDKENLLLFTQNDERDVLFSLISTNLGKYSCVIDKYVTTQITHPVKIPFSLHPTTKNISIPINPLDISTKTTLPTLTLQQLNKDNKLWIRGLELLKSF